MTQTLDFVASRPRSSTVAAPAANGGRAERPLTIGQAARESGLAPSTIRYYEAERVVPSPARTASGYRTYNKHDVHRLRLAHRARLLGLPLDEVRALVQQASGECAPLMAGLADSLAERRRVVAQQIAELQALAITLDTLEQQTRAARCAPAQPAADCDPLPLYSGVIELNRKEDSAMRKRPGGCGCECTPDCCDLDCC